MITMAENFITNYTGDILSSNTDLTEVFDIAESIADLFRKHIKDSGVTASGELENFTARFNFNNKYLELVFELPQYWRFVEDGRNPTKATTGDGVVLEQIKKWVTIKGINPKPVAKVWTTKKGVQKCKVTIPKREQIAYAITNKIHEQGFEGKHFYKNAMNELQSNGMITRLTNAISNALAREFETILYQ